MGGCCNVHYTISCVNSVCQGVSKFAVTKCYVPVLYSPKSAMVVYRWIATIFSVYHIFKVNLQMI